MSFSSLITCGLRMGNTCNGDSDDTSSCCSIMDYFHDFPLCGQETEDVEVTTTRRPPFINTTSGRVPGMPHGRQIMQQPWRPPTYRDTSLLAAATPFPYDVGGKNQHQTTPSLSKILAPSVGIISCDDSDRSSRQYASNSLAAPESNGESSLPLEFVPPKHSFCRPFKSSTNKEQQQDDQQDPAAIFLKSHHLTLEPNDVVCGRGAPTSIHPGNLAYKKTIKMFEMEYLCATRGEKPKIATKLMEEFRANGVRFVKREKKIGGDFVWVEVGNQRIYEKICQSLRECAPQLRRKIMMSSEGNRKKSAIAERKVPQVHNRNRKSHPQQRQDSDTSMLSSDGRRTDSVHAHHHSHPSSFSMPNSTNVDHTDPMLDQNLHYMQIPYYANDDGKDEAHDKNRNYHDPYYVHLPPHLGGERLFGDRVE